MNSPRMFHVKHCGSFSKCYIIDIICMVGKAEQGSPFAHKYFVKSSGKTLRTHRRGKPFQILSHGDKACHPFASLRACPERSEGMTGRTPLKPAHGKLSLQISK